MSDQDSNRRSVSIPVDELGSLSRRVDATADDMDAAMRRLRVDSDDVRLNDAEPGFSPSRFGSRLLSVTEGVQRTTARLRGTASLMADTEVLATEADRLGTDPAVADSPSPPVDAVVDRLAGQRAPSTSNVANPDWQQVWSEANPGQGPDAEGDHG